MAEPLRDSHKILRLEKAIKSNHMDANQLLVIQYLKLLLKIHLENWVAGRETVDVERLRGEAACLRNLISILTNSKELEFFEGDN